MWLAVLKVTMFCFLQGAQAMSPAPDWVVEQVVGGGEYVAMQGSDAMCKDAGGAVYKCADVANRGTKVVLSKIIAEGDNVVTPESCTNSTVVTPDPATLITVPSQGS